VPSDDRKTRSPEPIPRYRSLMDRPGSRSDAVRDSGLTEALGLAERAWVSAGSASLSAEPERRARCWVWYRLMNHHRTAA
jgi:hypothetical protein